MMAIGAANCTGNQRGRTLELLRYFNYFTASAEEHRAGGATKPRFFVAQIHLQCASTSVKDDTTFQSRSASVLGWRKTVP